jgi:hypothetical protein
VSPWWQLRQRLGGRVDADAFRAAVDRLIAGGELLEVWLARPDRRDAAHVLLLPGHSAALSRPVARARGNPEALRREPWWHELAGPGSSSDD